MSITHLFWCVIYKNKNKNIFFFLIYAHIGQEILVSIYKPTLFREFELNW